MAHTCVVTATIARRGSAPVRWRLPTLGLWLVSRLVLVLNVVLLGHRCDQVFWTYGHATVALHQVPYRDYGVEYPPLAVALFLVPGAAHDWPAYAALFALLMLLVDLAAVLLVRRAAARSGAFPPGRVPAGDGWRAALYYVALSFATTALLTKYDLVPGLVTLAAVLALERGRDGMAWAALAAAVLLKGYAVVLAPLFLLYRYRLPLGERPWWRGPVAGAACLVPVLAVAGPGLAAALLFHANRGLELESLYASVILVAHALGGLPVGVRGGNAVTSRDVYSSLNGPLGTLAPWALLVGLTVTYAVAWARLRHGATPEALLVLSMAAVAAFMLSFKALPAHYLLWLIPSAAVALGRPAPESGAGSGWTHLTVLFVVTAVLSAAVPAVWLPLRHLEPFAIAVMVSRNLALVAVFVGLLLQVSSRPRGPAGPTATAIQL